VFEIKCMRIECTERLAQAAEFVTFVWDGKDRSEHRVPQVNAVK
jgi:hypothetical protein